MQIEEILHSIFSCRQNNEVYPIVAGSFPAYWWAKRVGLRDSIPSDTDIDVYCIAPNLESAMSLYESLTGALSSFGDKVQVHKPQSMELYTTWASHPYLIVSQFDISVARVWMEDEETIKWINGEDPLGDMKEGRIRVIRVVNPIKEVYRIVKYTKRGFSVDKDSILKLFLEWEHMSQRDKMLVISQIGVMSTTM